MREYVLQGPCFYGLYKLRTFDLPPTVAFSLAYSDSFFMFLVHLSAVPVANFGLCNYIVCLDTRITFILNINDNKIQSTWVLGSRWCVFGLPFAMGRQINLSMSELTRRT
jgi:hypothetical protein